MRAESPTWDDAAGNYLDSLGGAGDAQVDAHEDPKWPGLDKDAACHGVIGELVSTIEPHTESDPAAILFQALALAGCCIGRSAYYPVEGDKHQANLNVVLVGQSSKGRKGTSLGQVRRAFKLADRNFVDSCMQSGLSSGEGLIWAVRDANENDPTDMGVLDKRLLVAESEFAGLLKVMQREGNIISRIIRDAWDRGDLGVMTKKCPTQATGAHIGIVGHITSDELRRYLDRTEAANGFANRFLYVAVKRSKCLPFGGELNDNDLIPIAREMADAFEHAKALADVSFDAAARDLWASVYPALSEGAPGLHGSVTGRAEAQVVRVSLIYALMDQKNKISVDHLTAALAVWDYADESARYVFGDASGDPTRDAIESALKSNREGLNRTAISGFLGRHVKAHQIDRTLAELNNAGLVRMETIETGGRPKEIWRWL
jgi:hypothetical protein